MGNKNTLNPNLLSMDKIRLPGAIVIAGNARNVGKTTLALALIGKYSARYPVVGLKVSTLYPDDSSFHGQHTEKDSERSSLFYETCSDRPKDTSRFLKAGACDAWYLRSRESYLKESFLLLMDSIPQHRLIVCESRSIMKLVKPDLFVLIKKNTMGSMLKDISDLLPLADVLIHCETDPYDLSFFSRAIEYNGQTWQYNP
mgnify:CR=1 FL=1